MKTKAIPTWHLTDAQTVRVAKEAVDSLLKMDLCSLCKAADLPLYEVERILAKLAKDWWIDVALNSPGAAEPRSAAIDGIAPHRSRRISRWARSHSDQSSMS